MRCSQRTIRPKKEFWGIVGARSFLPATNRVKPLMSDDKPRKPANRPQHLMSGRNVRQPHHVLPPGESIGVCQQDRRTDGQTDRWMWMLDRYTMHSARNCRDNN